MFDRNRRAFITLLCGAAACVLMVRPETDVRRQSFIAAGGLRIQY
jgi:hypothetical protein